MVKQFSTIMLVAATLFFAGCGGNSKETAKLDGEMKRTLDACISANPNYNNNELTRSALADSIKTRFQTYRGKQLKQIEAIPCEYETAIMYDDFYGAVYDSTLVGKYVVKFSYSDMYELDSRISNEYNVMLQIFSIVEKETAMQLAEGKEYYISGTFKDFMNDSKETGIRLPDGQYYIGYPSVISTSSSSVGTTISLGAFVLENITFELAE